MPSLAYCSLSESIIGAVIEIFAVGFQLVLLMSSSVAVVNASTTCTDVTVVSIALMDPTKSAVCIRVSMARKPHSHRHSSRVTASYTIMLLCVSM